MALAVKKLLKMLKTCLYVQLLATFVLLIVLRALWEWIQKQADPASWAQAVGTIVAIGVAIAAPAIQHRKEVAVKRAELLAEKSSKIENLSILVTTACSVLYRLSNQINGNWGESIAIDYGRQIGLIANHLNSHIMELPDVDTISHAVHFVTSLKKIESSLNNFVFIASPYQREKFNETVVGAALLAETMNNALRSVMTEMSSQVQ